MNSTFITPVPPTDWSVKVRDHHSINLVTSIYKIIAKVLTLRLCEVLANTISHNQCAFVPGRQIINAAHIANDIVEDIRHWKGKVCFLNWIMRKLMIGLIGFFMDKVMCKNGFGVQWRKWIMGCLCILFDNC